MPRIIRRTKTTTRTITPDGKVLEATPVIHESVTETDAVGLVGTDAVQLPTRTSVVERVIQPPAADVVVEEVIEAPVVEHVVVEEPVQRKVIRRVRRKP